MQSPNDLTQIARGIFTKFHGRFGNQFLDKFRTGKTIETDSGPRDAGIESAIQTWAAGINGLTADQIKHGLLGLYDYPPSLDVFKAMCLTYRRLSDFSVKLPPPRRTDEQIQSNRELYLETRERLGWRKTA
ncbi:MAG TPA: hypothetical protein VN023_09475 [Methylovorus sp.]|nr:hypothetical protein [Methylovorus sp.]